MAPEPPRSTTPSAMPTIKNPLLRYHGTVTEGVASACWHRLFCVVLQIRRQMLGAMGDLTDDGLPLTSPLYLFPTDDAHVPLKGWAEARGMTSRTYSGH